MKPIPLGVALLSVALFAWATVRYCTPQDPPTPQSRHKNSNDSAIVEEDAAPSRSRSHSRSRFAAPSWQKNLYIVPRAFIREPLPLDDAATPLLMKELKFGASYALVQTTERFSLWSAQQTLRSWCHLGAFQLTRAEQGNLLFASLLGKKRAHPSKLAQLAVALNGKLELEIFPVRSPFALSLLPCASWVEVEKASPGASTGRMRPVTSSIVGKEELKIGQCKKLHLSRLAVLAYEDTQAIEIKSSPLTHQFSVCAHKAGRSKIRTLEMASGAIYETTLHIKKKK